jgi:glucose-1-phosphate thymidylyltransferase
MTRGIILAGGTGSRLGPLSKVTNKHLLPLGSSPMIFHPISQMLENGITDICVVSGLFHLGSMVELLGSGIKYSCKFTYKVQDAAGGIAEALILCRDFAGDQDIAVILGDNVFADVLNLHLPQGGTHAKFFLKKVEDPHRFGVAEVDHMKRLVDIEEKPENPKSDLAVTGAYVYSPAIWDACGRIGRSARGELEISDANKEMIRNGIVDTCELSGWWSDAGTQDSYRKANREIWDNLCPQLMTRITSMAQACRGNSE